MEGACWSTAAATSSTCTSTSTSTSSEEMKRKSTSSSSSSASGKARVYRGVRMRKWGKWVAEIREPKKRTRIWLGSYSTPVAAARAYDTAVFLLRGRSARLNFPEEISAVETELAAAAADSDCLSSASIRKKATEVGARIDALQMGLVMSSTNQKQQQQQQQRPDLNQHPTPDSSDDE